jgi:D-threo-aldose 1-dehydrogenase
MSRYAPHGPLGMGGAPIGNLFAPVPASVAAATVAAAWDAGVRHYDTAPHYGAGLSEHRMGDALRAMPRDRFTLSTKVGRLLEPAFDVPDLDEGFVGALPFRRRLDYSADGARRSIEDSLQRLGMNRIDIVYIHDVSEDWLGAAWTSHFADAMAGAARALSDLRAEGTIGAWGLGVNLAAPCLAALEAADPDVFLLAGRYTLLDTGSLDTLLPACAARGVRVVIGGPYNSGLLAGGTTFNYEQAAPQMVARAQAMGAVCARHGVDLRAAALQFCAAHPVVATVIPGARTPAEVTQNAALMAAPIPADVWGELKAEKLIPAHAPVPGSAA